MKIKKTFKIILIIFLIIITIFSSAFVPWLIHAHKVAKTINEAKTINAESNLGFDFLGIAPADEEMVQEHGIDYRQFVKTDDKLVSGYYTEFPIHSKERRLVYLSIDGGDYDIFGIHVGDDVQKSLDVLKKHGYKNSGNALMMFTENENGEYVDHTARADSYYKNDIHIELFADDESKDIIHCIIIMMNDY